MDAKSYLTDETPLEFTASVDDLNTLYSVSISCAVPFTEEEYANALIAFAQDILDGEFSFQNNSGASEVFSQ